MIEESRAEFGKGKRTAVARAIGKASLAELGVESWKNLNECERGDENVWKQSRNSAIELFHIYGSPEVKTPKTLTGKRS